MEICCIWKDYMISLVSNYLYLSEKGKVCVCVCMCEREGEHMAWMGEQWMTYCVELWLKFILCDRSIELFFDSMEKLS